MPSKTEVIFEYKSYQCIITFNNEGKWGWRCGYVKLPKGHPYYGFSMMQHVISNLEVHGGITFAASSIFPDVPGYLIGFDCGHGGDDLIKCSREYVEQQCKALIDQLPPFTIPLNSPKVIPCKGRKVSF